VVPEEIDLKELRRRLSEKFGMAPPAGYVEGKGALRAAVVELLGCSELEAEQLVDTMETRGFIRYQGDPREQVDRLERHWSLG
jgi:hypothetical protein